MFLRGARQLIGGWRELLGALMARLISGVVRMRARVRCCSGDARGYPNRFIPALSVECLFPFVALSGFCRVYMDTKRVLIFVDSCSFCGEGEPRGRGLRNGIAIVNRDSA